MLHVPAGLYHPHSCKLFLTSQVSLPMYCLYRTFCLKYPFTETIQCTYEKNIHIVFQCYMFRHFCAILFYLNLYRPTLHVRFSSGTNLSTDYILTWHLHKVQQTWATSTAGSIVRNRHEFASCHLNDCLRVVCRLLWRMVSLYANKYEVILNESPWPLHERGQIFRRLRKSAAKSERTSCPSVCLSVSTWNELSHNKNF